WRPAALQDRHLTALAIDPARPSRVYAGTGSGLVYRTTDRAATWTLSFFSPGPAVTAIAVSPDSTAYATTASGALYKSSDGGDHWAPLNPGFHPRFPYVVNAPLASDPSSSQPVYV